MTELKTSFEQAERAAALKAQMAPLHDSFVNDRVMLDSLSGAFYLRSDVEQKGMDASAPLGYIDVASESALFRTTARQVLSEKIQTALNTPRPA